VVLIALLLFSTMKVRNNNPILLVESYTTNCNISTRAGVEDERTPEQQSKKKTATATKMRNAQNKREEVLLEEAKDERRDKIRV